MGTITIHTAERHRIATLVSIGLQMNLFTLRQTQQSAQSQLTVTYSNIWNQQAGALPTMFSVSSFALSLLTSCQSYWPTSRFSNTADPPASKAFSTCCSYCLEYYPFLYNTSHSFSLFSSKDHPIQSGHYSHPSTLSFPQSRYHYCSFPASSIKI